MIVLYPILHKLFQVKIAVEVLLMLHLVSAFPIIVNPNNQFFEELLGFPKGIRSLLWQKKLKSQKGQRYHPARLDQPESGTIG
jgi:hypothetical protein